MLAFTVAPGFEGDQWTFFKPTATSSRSCTGSRAGAHDLAVAPRPRRVQLGLGAPRTGRGGCLSSPRTAGVSYRSAHQKTTIGIVGLDEEQGRLDYYHNAGRYQLSGDELDAVLSSRVLGADLPPFAELVDASHAAATPGDLQREASARRGAEGRLAGAGKSNPFSAWAARAAHDTARLRVQRIRSSSTPGRSRRSPRPERWPSSSRRGAIGSMAMRVSWPRRNRCVRSPARQGQTAPAGAPGTWWHDGGPRADARRGVRRSGAAHRQRLRDCARATIAASPFRSLHGSSPLGRTRERPSLRAAMTTCAPTAPGCCAPGVRAPRRMGATACPLTRRRRWTARGSSWGWEPDLGEEFQLTSRTCSRSRGATIYSNAGRDDRRRSAVARRRASRSTPRRTSMQATGGCGTASPS